MNDNGNNQLNTERENVNKRVNQLTFFGRTKRNQWNQRRRFRTI